MPLIDANVFLEVLLKQDNANSCIEFLEKVKDGEIKALLSIFTVDGVVLALERHGQSPEGIRTFLNSLLNYKGLKIYFPTINDRMLATAHMKLGLDFEDALTLQCAFSNNEKEIISFDRDFDKIKNIKRVQPPLPGE